MICKRFMEGSQEILGPFSQNIDFLKLQLFFFLSRPIDQVNSVFFSGSSDLPGSCYC